MEAAWWLVKFILLVFVTCMTMHYGKDFAEVKISSGSIVVIGLLCSLILIIPYVGWIIAIFFMLRLIMRLADADMWPDAGLITIMTMPVAYIFRYILF